MIRTILPALFLLLSINLSAGTFTIQVTAVGAGEDVVSLYRYDDFFTLRTVLIKRNIIGSDGRATLEGEVEGTLRVQLRIGDRSADLYVRPGSNLKVEPYSLPVARSLNGTTRMGLNFMEIDPLDVNALTSDVNERIDEFITEDLATDQAAGMQVVDIQRKEGAQAPDSTTRPPTLFVTPVLSEERLDTFEMKLRRFYAEVEDPWFMRFLDHSIAGLRFGPNMNERALFESTIKGKPIAYDDIEYVRTIRNFFNDGLSEVYRYHGDTLRAITEQEDAHALRSLFQHNDFLRSDDRLAELVMMDQLYLNHAANFIAAQHSEGILKSVAANSSYPEHRTIASNMLWDLTTMRVGSVLPEMRLEDARGQPVQLNELLTGPSCIAITAGWCTYCAPELSGLVQLAKEYPNAVNIIVIGLDKTLEEFNAAQKGFPANEFTWLHAVAEQDLREQLRLRSLPVFYLLNDTTLARSPAPPPSQGLGALFHQAKMKDEKDGRIKVWDD